MTKTNYQFKILYAIGMIVIVAGHCNNAGLSLAYEWFPPYAFHLALFAFGSGYFYKDSASENVKKYIWHKFVRLIIPMYLWNVFYAFLVYVSRFGGFTLGADPNLRTILWEPLVNGHQFEYNLGGWFVVPLFMIQILNVSARKGLEILHIRINEWIFFICTLILGIGGVCLAKAGYYELPWLFIDRILYFAPFFGLGILYNRKLEKMDNANNLLYFGVLFGLQLLITTRYGHLLAYTPSWCMNFTENAFMPFVVGILGIAFWLRVSKMLVPVLKDSKCIRLIADNTYSIMINQFLGIMLVKTGFAIVSRLTPLFADFNFAEYKSSLEYYYLPYNVTNWYLVYAIAGITVPILMQMIINIIKTVFIRESK